MEKSEFDDSLAYVKKKIELARLDESEISPVVQSLTFKQEHKDICLLQLNSDILSKLSEGDVLTIRGNPNETAVLCTDTCTYEIKEAETSNSLMLIPDMLWPEDCESGELRAIPQNVSGMFHTYYELRNFKPNFKKLRTVLERNAFKGKEFEDESAVNYTAEGLLEFIQASKAELEKALIDLQTCIIDGYVRILDFDYKFNVLSQIVNVIESRSLPLDKIPKDSIVEALEDLVPKYIVENCFSWFAHETNEIDENGQKLYKLDEYSVCRIYAEILLRAAGKFHLREFLESWQKSVPEGMTCSLEQLRGLALTDMNYRPEVIFHFPADDMPENIADIFSKLFKVKEKWTYDEIVPYLQDRAASGNDVKSLLIKYTRESTKDGVKLYSSKW